jgi:succinate dehydrogenase / fumarate reductase cytochrome b subunit
MGITWGVWISPAAQKRANVVCVIFGVGLGAVSMGALGGAITVDTEAAKAVEKKMYDAQIDSGAIDEEESEHKRSPDDANHARANAD